MTKQDIKMFLLGGLSGGTLVGLICLGIGAMLWNVSITVSRQAPASPPASPARATPTPAETESLRYALDGYCPVTLVENAEWKMGDYQYRQRYGTQVFLFAGREAQASFLEDPTRYVPALDGYDVVMAKDEGKTSRGKRKHGLTYHDRIYLFASEKSLQQFNTDPDLYAGYSVETLD
ncbi:hypothetical protein [Blastopirellula marina]|uniref:YHS domain-containing protein n=1 Tax=Blastopirellula marina TaxID=124 RepID=A0A2S8FLU7_9BACT|nr:hypothetical protein [Blastopirellula marina]PQO33127.1 hypothetical protein C5Y98_18530 [Blastopirellula marina]PTL43294.1 hypothetical protein C5Y97_18540 [Blastopirellula marina]